MIIYSCLIDDRNYILPYISIICNTFFTKNFVFFFTRRIDIKYYAKHVEITVSNKENVRLASIQNAAKRTKKVNTY